MLSVSLAYLLTLVKVFYSSDRQLTSIVISIPMSVLWQVRLEWRRKLALAAFFSLAVITMVVAVVRIAVVSAAKTDEAVQVDSSWLYLWENIELAVGKFTILSRRSYVLCSDLTPV